MKHFSRFSSATLIFSSAQFRLLSLPLLCAAVLLLTGCGSDDDHDGFKFAPAEGAPASELRVLHAVADAPRVNVFINGERVLSGVDFRAGSGFLRLIPATYNVRVEAIVPGGNVDIIDERVPFAVDTRTTILAVGDVTEGSVGPLPVTNAVGPVSAGNVRVQVTHASPDAPPVYLAVTTPDFPIEQAQYLGPLSYTESTEALEIPAGEYQIRVAVGTPNPSFDDNDVVFDSGRVDLPQGLDLQAVAVTSTVPSQAGAAGSPISVVLLDGEGSSDLFDARTGADLRVVHNSVGAPAVDVVVDVVDTPADENLTIAAGLTFGNVAGYLVPAVAPVAYDVSVVLSANTNAEALAFTADLMPGMAYTAIANDVVANITAVLLVDDNRRVATEAKLRLFHGSPSAGPVDIYVIPSALGLLPADTEPTFAGVEFATETGFVGVAADTYDIYVTAQGGDSPAISVPGLVLGNSGVYTAIARDPLVPGDALGLILLDDLAP